MNNNGWKSVKLSEILTSVSETYKFNQNQKVTLINTSDILEGKVLNHKKEYPNNVAGQFKKTFRKGDILYSEIRPINKRFAYVDFEVENYVASTKLMVLRNKSEIVNNNYLYQFLKSNDTLIKLQLIAESRSGTFPQITFLELSKLEIFIPQLNEQKSIANILSSLDDKIELSNKANETLEELAQTLYKQWFVDFEFPNENGESYKSSGGKMVDSELGLIPEGWITEKLGNIITIRYGKNYPTKNLLEKGYPVYGGNGIIGFSENYMYKDPVVIVSCRGAASGAVHYTKPRSFITNNSLILENNMKINFEYLKERSINQKYFKFVTGSAQPQITINSIKEDVILVPMKSTQDLFSKLLSPINDLIYFNEKSNEILAETRDLLLPKLMSGEIRVPVKE